MALIIIRIVLVAFAVWAAVVSYMLLAEYGMAPVPGRPVQVAWGEVPPSCTPSAYALYLAQVPRHTGLTRYESLIQEARLIPSPAARAQVLAQIKRYEHAPSALTLARARALKGEPLLSYEQWAALQDNND